MSDCTFTPLLPHPSHSDSIKCPLDTVQPTSGVHSASTELARQTGEEYFTCRGGVKWKEHQQPIQYNSVMHVHHMYTLHTLPFSTLVIRSCCIINILPDALIKIDSGNSGWPHPSTKSCDPDSAHKLEGMMATSD